ncbi:hypothetical protein CPB85DRAFT_1324610 [Mucidula mucida]|nr:hypothetical protein CPB85DRAFT_1324610 [Mucidula mucida]
MCSLLAPNMDHEQVSPLHYDHFCLFPYRRSLSFNVIYQPTMAAPPLKPPTSMRLLFFLARIRTSTPDLALREKYSALVDNQLSVSIIYSKLFICVHHSRELAMQHF